MAYHYEKETGDLVVDGFERGIAQSPHLGIANIQNANISTDTGEVMASYSRTQQSQNGDTSTSHTITPNDSTHLAANFGLIAGQWINISASSITNLSTGDYYVLNSTGTVGGGSASSLQLASSYNGANLTTLGATGSATFTIKRIMGAPIAQATEEYSTGSAVAFRYYVLDVNGLVWVNDSADSIEWFLPDISITYYTAGTPSGMAVMNNVLHVFVGNSIWCKNTMVLGASYVVFGGASAKSLISAFNSTNPHFAYVGHQGCMYYTDGNFLGKIFPNTSVATGLPNIQSCASYTSSSTTGTIATLIGGSVPSATTSRIPVSVFASVGGAVASALATTTLVYLEYTFASGAVGTFQLFAALSGGSALDITSGASGTQYFNTYQPMVASGFATIGFFRERLNLPYYEIAQSMTEIGNVLVIGTQLNTLYPWNQVSAIPQDIIPLPENNTSYLLTVGNMALAFSGNKGNIYITNGATASLVISVPDYCAGIDGTKNSYIEPYFTWGGAAYIRGRVYFSILDQTSAKAGNCGGIWSFVPTQNIFIGQDQGVSLRLEAQNSYGTYSGYAPVIIPSQTQAAKGPQYWSAWQSSTSSPTYGIDFSGTVASTVATIETDIIPTGQMLTKRTFKQVEYKLSAPLTAGESVAISARQDSTSSFVALTPIVQDSTTALSGFFTVNFEGSAASTGQWLQLRATLTPNGTGTGSFVRLKQLRIR